MPVSKKPRKKYNSKKSKQNQRRQKTSHSSEHLKLDLKAIAEEQAEMEWKILSPFYEPIKDSLGRTLPNEVNEIGQRLAYELNQSCYQHDQDQYFESVQGAGLLLNELGGTNYMDAVLNLLPSWGQSEISKMWNGIGEWRG